MRLPVQSGGVLPSSRSGVRPSFGFCVSVTVQNGQVCVDIPIFGKYCVSIPVPLPPGTAAQACVSSCGSWIPTGACVTVTALGHQIAHQCVGSC
ncbi:hypothetical protein [Rhizobium sp. FY34]|uniref:hypothetical protein n=1 Tax=Rhizobium sp. FY34 TaxID=2562309 RepID=UPI0010C11563|nr:hypothetical protein [Rhizobium sp. FY34]